MAIVRPQQPDQYTVIDDATLADERLSWGARGLLAYLLSKPDDWIVQPKQLMKVGTSGRDAVYKMLGELESCGYARKQQTRTGGKFARSEWVIYSTSQTQPSRPENPDTVPYTAFQDAVRPMQYQSVTPCPEKPDAVQAVYSPHPENTDTAKYGKTLAAQDVTPYTEKPDTVPCPEKPDTAERQSSQQDQSVAPCTDSPYTENQDAYLVLSNNTHPRARERTREGTETSASTMCRHNKPEDATTAPVLSRQNEPEDGQLTPALCQQNTPTLAFGDVVKALEACGTPFHFCTGQRDRDVIRSWQEAGVTHTDLNMAIGRAAQRNKGGAIGPRYLDPFLKQVVTERLTPNGGHHGSQNTGHHTSRAGARMASLFAIIQGDD